MGAYTRHSPYAEDCLTTERKQAAGKKYQGLSSMTERSQTRTNHSIWQTFNVSPVLILYLPFKQWVEMACLETKAQILW